MGENAHLGMAEQSCCKTLAPYVRVWWWDAGSLAYHKLSKLVGSLSVLFQWEKSMEVWHSGKLLRVNKCQKEQKPPLMYGQETSRSAGSCAGDSVVVFVPLRQPQIHAWVWPHLKHSFSDSIVPTNAVLEDWLVDGFFLENSHPGRVQPWPT